MRILFVNFEYPPLGGGGGVFTSLLAQEMSKRHEVTVLTSHEFGPHVTGRMENGVKVIRVPVYFRKLKAAANIHSMFMYILTGIRVGKKLVSTQSFDIINTHFALPSGPVGDALARFGRLPNVLSILGGDIYDPSKATSPHRHLPLRIWVRRLLRRANVVVGESTDILEKMRRYYTPENAGVRIPLGIRRIPPMVDDACREEYGCKQTDILLVTIGRLVARKAVHQLIATLGMLREGHIRLVIIGAGPEEHRLKNEVSRRQLGGQVLFMGHVDEAEKFRVLRMCDFYVSTSQHEGFGLVFLEAMACGLPIVCYDHGGQTDFLRDGENGFLVPLNDCARFLERCQALINDVDLRKAMGARNRIEVQEYLIEKNTTKYEALFRKLLALNVLFYHHMVEFCERLDFIMPLGQSIS